MATRSPVAGFSTTNWSFADAEDQRVLVTVTCRRYAGRRDHGQRNLLIAPSTSSDNGWVELRHLEHFLAVADTRSFTQAAARLHVVQSGVSATIKALERELGADLFARGPAGVTLTPAGEELRPRARAQPSTPPARPKTPSTPPAGPSAAPSPWAP